MSYATLVQDAIRAVPADVLGSCSLVQMQNAGTYDRQTETWDSSTPLRVDDVPCVVTALRPDRATPPGLTRTHAREVFVAALDCGSLTPDDMTTTCTIGTREYRVVAVEPIGPDDVNILAYVLVVSVP